MPTLPVSVFREAPREAAIVLAWGQRSVNRREIDVSVTTLDYATGFNNVVDIKLWGDIDVGFEQGTFGASELNSAWIPYRPVIPVVLSVSSGVKEIHARLRNASGAESAELVGEVALAISAPHVSMLWTDGKRLPAVGTLTSFAWSASHDFTAAAVMLAPTVDADYDDCIELTALPGGTAGATVATVVAVDDILTGDLYPTQSGDKLLRVFISVAGSWYT